MTFGGASELERRPGEVGVEGKRQESSGVSSKSVNCGYGHGWPLQLYDRHI